MNTPALPAYLQNRQSQGVAARATSGMGGVLPPHISIAGNCFTLIDAAGNKMPLGGTMQACVIDICDHMNKRYYENDWTPSSDEPPTCFSRNGVAPSRDSQTPQSPTCAQCQWNVRGSDTSKLSNKPIKACRDEKDVALLLPQFPTMLFQMTIPPGSFKNWSGFIAPFKPGGPDVSDVLVSFGFQPQANGVMTFQATSYIDEATAGGREAALASKATDVLVGRNDVPIAIAHQPSQVQQPGPLPAPTAAAPTGNPSFGRQEQPSAPLTQPDTPTAFGQGSAATASPSEPPKTRTRRTQAQIAADNAAKAAQAGAPSPAVSAPVQPAQVPFPVNQPTQGFGVAPGAANGGPAFGAAPSQPGFGVNTPASVAQQNQVSPQPAGAQFGIQPGQDPSVDPQLAAMLASLENQ